MPQKQGVKPGELLTVIETLPLETSGIEPGEERGFLP
jgi:hypothetical protein